MIADREQISTEAEELVSCLKCLLDQHGLCYRLEEVDLSRPESIWYQVNIETRPESGLPELALHAGRDFIALYCNDYQIFICLTEQPAAFGTWLEHLRLIIPAVFRPELRIRGRFSLLYGGKTAAIWLELPDGGKWMGDRKACKGSGKELVFKDPFQLHGKKAWQAAAGGGGDPCA